MIKLWNEFTRTGVAEMRVMYYDELEDVKNLTDKGISISKEDLDAGSPKDGDMIARNPENHDDQWLVAAQYFKDNFEEKK